MEVVIRNAVKEDMSSVWDLIHELAVFEKEPDAVEVTIEDLQRDGFDNPQAFQCFVAQQDTNIVGIALVFTRYSTWKGIALHLEDLIVKEQFRGKGVGTKLLDRVVAYGKELKVRRISWDVLDWNQSAIDFYQSKGAKVLRDWDVVHLDQEGIKNYKFQ